MSRNDLFQYLLVGFLTLFMLRVFEYYKVNDPFITFGSLALMLFVVSNLWKNVRI